MSEEQRKVAEEARDRHARATSASRATEAATSRAQVLAAHQRALAVDDTPIETVRRRSLRRQSRRSRTARRRANGGSAADLPQPSGQPATRSNRGDRKGPRRRPQLLPASAATRLALAEEPGTTLAPRAAELASGVDAIRESIDAELAEVHKHREGLIERLSTLVEQRLKLLKLAQRMSMVPAGLGDWSGNPFLTIAFQTPDASTLGRPDGCSYR